MKREELKEKEREFIKRHFKENLKINLEDLVKNGIMTKEEFNRFLDKQFNMRFKTCNCCGFIKPKTEFYRSKLTKDNTYSYCRECQNMKCRPGKKKQRDKKREEFGGFYVYLIFSKSTHELMYVGESSNIYNRMISHFYGCVGTTKELFENDDVGLIKYVELNSKEEAEVLEVGLINNKIRNNEEPYISISILEEDYVIDYPRLNKKRGSGKMDKKLLINVCSKIKNGEYTWKTWKEFGDNDR